MPKAIIKNTNAIAVVKLWGTNTTETLSLAELLDDTEVLVGTQIVNVASVTWYCDPAANSHIHISRNSVEIFDLYQNGQFDMNGNYSFVDNIENTSGFSFTFNGNGGVYLTLRKAAGYELTVEEWKFGQYDNPTIRGA